MTPQTLQIIRAMIDAGATDSVICATLLAMVRPDGYVAPVDTPPSPARPISGTSAVRLGSPAVTRSTFVGKPNQTSVSYRSTIKASQLDKYGLTGNKRAVMEFVIANGSADSRAMRAAILTHKLRADGTNKAIESAVHALKTDGYLTVKAKPVTAQPRPTVPGNGVELD